MPMMRTAVGPVRGHLGVAGSLIVATLDRDDAVTAIDSATLEPKWLLRDVPTYAASTANQIYLYSRTGLVMAVNLDGSARWRVVVPDDRSKQARSRGDREAPFSADVLTVGNSIYLACGNEVMRLAASDGSILGRATATGSPRGIVARLSAAGERVVATTTGRTDWDDEVHPPTPLPFQPEPTLESRRTDPGELIVFDLDLHQIGRASPPEADLVYGNARPLILEDRTIVSLAVRAGTDPDGNRYIDVFKGRIFRLDRELRLRWIADAGGGPNSRDPIPGPEGVVAGFDPVFYNLADGKVRWSVRSDQSHIDNRVPFLANGDRLLAAGTGALMAIAFKDGHVTELFRLDASERRSRIVTTMLVNSAKVFCGIEPDAKLVAIDLSP